MPRYHFSVFVDFPFRQTQSRYYGFHLDYFRCVYIIICFFLWIIGQLEQNIDTRRTKALREESINTHIYMLHTYTRYVEYMLMGIRNR